MSDKKVLIPGGYIIIARKILQNPIMDKPPLYLKLWLWMLEKANHKDGYRNLKRGQFFTTISEMQEAMGYRVGYRQITPTRDQIRNAYEHFTNTTMITTTKTTRGMVVTILNYDFYQNPKNYKAHTEPHDENTTKPTEGPHYKQEGNKKGQKGNVKDPKVRIFQNWWFEKYRHGFNKDYLVTNWREFSSQIKSLLRLPLSFEDVQYLAIEFFMDNDSFLTGDGDKKGTGHNIGMFLRRINQNTYREYQSQDFREKNKKHILNETGKPLYPDD